MHHYYLHYITFFYSKESVATLKKKIKKNCQTVPTLAKNIVILHIVVCSYIQSAQITCIFFY